MSRSAHFPVSVLGLRFDIIGVFLHGGVEETGWRRPQGKESFPGY